MQAILHVHTLEWDKRESVIIVDVQDEKDAEKVCREIQRNNPKTVNFVSLVRLGNHIPHYLRSEVKELKYS